MKIAEKLKPSRLFSKDRKGVALVTVLTVMALTTILVLTFFSLATSEHRASSTYSNGLQAQQVAEQAVNLVIAQIREATSVGNTKAWASQPGAIRVWGEDGREDFAYKLYSDDVMKTTKWDDFQNDFRALNDWSDSPEHFVDLNEPVIRGEKVYYPIVHPLASTKPQWPKPLGNDLNGVEGFWYNDTKKGGVVLTDPSPIGRKAAQILKADGHVAMPVTWVYQLADGTLGTLERGAPGAPSYKFRALSPGGTPSADNPIVARFAFWADDETSKLNINTHAGGLAWDVPRVGGELDMAMGKYQPAQKEWQRYPGHPASTHLSPALAPGVLDIVNDRDAMEMLYSVVPRVVGGGSESGTRIIDTRNPKEANGLIADKEPLFPSLDDVIMKSDRTPHRFPDAKGRPIPADELSEYLERSKFFITVNSRAPETNMFNKPRVAIWPVYNAAYGTGAPEGSPAYNKYLTAFDRLIHFCASMGKAQGAGGGVYPRYEYIFKREKADSSTYDIDQIIRNRQLYDYLVSFMNTQIPGYPGSFADKYGEEGAAQIITEIFDYIRSTNLHDDTLYSTEFAEAFRTENTNEHITYTNPRDGNAGNLGFGLKGHGQVTPIKIDLPSGVTTKGMGRFFTLSGAEIIVACVAEPGANQYMFPGVSSHYTRHEIKVTASDPRVFTNLPPLPIQTGPPGDTNPAIGKTITPASPKDQWPDWLKALEPGTDSGGLPTGNAAEFAAAFDETQWNWNLAYLDPAYLGSVMANPTLNKFKQTLVTKEASDRMRLLPDEKMVQAIFLFNMFCPSINWGSINPDMQIEIKADNGMTFQSGGVKFLGWNGQGANPNGQSDVFVWATNWAKPHREGGLRAWGGLLPSGYVIQGRDALGELTNSQASVWRQLFAAGHSTSELIRSRLTPLDRGYNEIPNALNRVKGMRDIGGNANDIAQAYRYDLVTIPFKVKSGPSPIDIKFDGGEVTFRIFDGGEYCEGMSQDDEDSSDSSSLVQTLTLKFPPFSFPATSIAMAPGAQGWVNEFEDLSHDTTSVLQEASLTADPANPWTSAKHSAQARGGTWRNKLPNTPRVDNNSAMIPLPPGSTNNRAPLNARGRMASAANHWDGRYIRDQDIVQTLAVPHGDVRLVAAKTIVVPDDELIIPHRKYGSNRMAHSLTNAEGGPKTGFDPTQDKDYLIVAGLPTTASVIPYRSNGVGGGSALPMPFAKDKSETVQFYGDFDNGSGTMIDGPYINKPDEGNVHSLKTRFTQAIEDQWAARRNYGDFPYFSNPEKAEAGGPAYFSPNRIVSGPGMFGSLPTGSFSKPPRPWQTLLFRPNVVGNKYASHPGAMTPPDHLIMDLFWMPVVEPYAISEPLSTGGKVNMNYQMVPFLHVHRDTALRGVFRSEFMVCVPNNLHTSYKHNNGRGQGYHWKDNPFGGAIQVKRLRSVIVEDETLKQFEKHFSKGLNAFKSSTEICDIHLIPQEVSQRLGSGTAGGVGSYQPNLKQMQEGNYWRAHSLVGDNSRERPYTNIQTRLTSKSNTFLVHYRAQVLKQSRRDSDGEYGEWRPEIDSVQAEYRGSSMVERYVDPNSDDIPDFVTEKDKTLDVYYRYRVVNPRRFAP